MVLISAQLSATASIVVFAARNSPDANVGSAVAPHVIESNKSLCAVRTTVSVMRSYQRFSFFGVVFPCCSGASASDFLLGQETERPRGAGGDVRPRVLHPRSRSSRACRIGRAIACPAMHAGVPSHGHLELLAPYAHVGLHAAFFYYSDKAAVKGAFAAL